jgi:hypothetical protein
MYIVVVCVNKVMSYVQNMADPGILESRNRDISRTFEARRRVALWTREVSESSRNEQKVAVLAILEEFALFPCKTRINDVSGGVGTKVDTKWTLLCPGFLRGRGGSQNGLADLAKPEKLVKTVSK